MYGKTQDLSYRAGRCDDMCSGICTCCHRRHLFYPYRIRSAAAYRQRDGFHVSERIHRPHRPHDGDPAGWCVLPDLRQCRPADDEQQQTAHPDPDSPAGAEFQPRILTRRFAQPRCGQRHLPDQKRPICAGLRRQLLFEYLVARPADVPDARGLQLRTHAVHALRHHWIRIYDRRFC